MSFFCIISLAILLFILYNDENNALKLVTMFLSRIIDLDDIVSVDTYYTILN